MCSLSRCSNSYSRHTFPRTLTHFHTATHLCTRLYTLAHVYTPLHMSTYPYTLSYTLTHSHTLSSGPGRQQEAGGCTRPLHSPSRRSAWPAAPCHHCTPCTCCRRSGSSEGAPHAGLTKESSPWKYTPQPGYRSPLSYLMRTGDKWK